MNDTIDAAVERREADQTSRRDKPYGYYAALISLYNVLFGAFLFIYRRRTEKLPHVTPLDLGMLGLATFRLSKAISEDEITTVVRKPIIDEDQRQPEGTGLRYSVGKLLLCPTCVGTWVAAFLTYALHLFPAATRPFLAVMSASGISQFADALLCLVYTDRNLLRKQGGE